MSPHATRYVDLAASGAATGRCVVLPGRQYTPDCPLLFFATQAALIRGWDVRQVWWEAAERGSLAIVDEIAWVGDQLDSAGPLTPGWRACSPEPGRARGGDSAASARPRIS